MTTGIGIPFSIFAVAALNCLQKSMMARPRWPSAGPIGGEGLAAPAGTCNLMYPVIFFAITQLLLSGRARPVQDRGADLGGWRPPAPPTFNDSVKQTMANNHWLTCPFSNS